jgi:uncharacterized protein YciI
MTALLLLALLAPQIAAHGNVKMPAGAPSAPARSEPAATPAATPVSGPTTAPPGLEAYQLVILQRPEHQKDYPQEKLEEIQKGHLAHLGAMAEAGKLVVAGPFGDQPDPKLRGLALYRVGSLAEAKRLAEDDPAVKAGRLEVVVFTWYTQKGALEFPVANELVKKAAAKKD